MKLRPRRRKWRINSTQGQSQNSNLNTGEHVYHSPTLPSSLRITHKTIKHIHEKLVAEVDQIGSMSLAWVNTSVELSITGNLRDSWLEVSGIWSSFSNSITKISVPHPHFSSSNSPLNLCTLFKCHSEFLFFGHIPPTVLRWYVSKIHDGSIMQRRYFPL